MRIHGTLVVVAIAAISLLGSARAFGQDELPTPAKERNAALLYWQYRALESSTTLLYMDLPDDPAWIPDEAVCQQLTQSQDAVGLLLRAGAQKTCDWGIEYELGMDATLSHTVMARGATRVLRADARRLAAAGDMSGATDRVVAIFALVRHLCHHEARLPERTQAASVATVAAKEVQWLLEHGGIGSEDSLRLAAEVRNLTKTDPFGFVDGIKATRANLDNDLYRVVYPFFEKKIIKNELIQIEGANLKDVVQRTTIDQVRLISPPVASAMDKAAEAWTNDNAVEVLTGIWDRKEELGLANMLLPKLQDSKEAELRVIARASTVMALFPEEVQRKAEQQAREPAQKPPRF